MFTSSSYHSLGGLGSCASFVKTLVLSSIMVTSSRFSWSTCDPACQMELTRTRRVLEKQDYSGYVPSPDDYDYNGFYRRQGDVPSPGIGH
ncbi:hypothetical protein Gorai_003956 [Gossypium raimondii]|uniref:Uncharacterized protein n=1 Tax=Gossypium raimondii TaxID=29730 RepID=A0A7J8QHP3_GOSRA|nr:hypothetical protein [Gossypium raimondii]